MDKTNDKLPEEIQEDISLGAKAFAAGMWSGISKHDANQRIYVASVWEAGATAWAPWKVKYDDAKRDFERVQKSAIHYANRKDEVEKQLDELQAQAKSMADALDALKEGAPRHTITFIDKALKQWKDGKGEEDKVYRPCPHCGKELFRDRNLCCRACGKEVENG